MKNHFDISGSIEIREVDIAGVACTYSSLNAMSKEEYARKRIHNGCLIHIENPVTQDNCSASLGKPRDVEHLPS